MKCRGSAAAVALSLGLAPANAFTLVNNGLVKKMKKGDSPVDRVVELIEDLKEKIEKDGENEQKAYDKFACWCEDTLQEKSVDIEKGQRDISKMDTRAEKLNGDLGAHGAAIEQLKLDIEQNVQSQKEAEANRRRQHKKYEAERLEAEQCLGSLELAINVLDGSGDDDGGDKKKKFLQTSYKEAQLLSVAAEMRDVVSNQRVQKEMSADKLDMIRKFIDKPEDFMSNHLGGLSLSQVSANPYGDYAPASGQITGILKDMYDTFTKDLEKANAEESKAAESHETLMEVKEKEEDTLKLTLQKNEHDQAAKTTELAELNTNRDDARKQLKADEDFFAKTKERCKIKGRDWASRSRLRTEELTGIEQGLAILTSPEAQETFEKSKDTFFLQFSSETDSVNMVSSKSGALTSYSHKKRAKAYAKLKELATKFHNVKMAELAAQVKMGGHFDKIIPMVENMMLLLKKEEGEDIEERNRCKNKKRKNDVAIADLEFEIDETEKKMNRMEDDRDELETTIENLETSIQETNETLKNGNEDRVEELEAMKEALKDDYDAVDLLNKAIVKLSEFYKNNKIPLNLAQESVNKKNHYQASKKGEPDDAPETGFQSGDYQGRKDEGGGIIAILTMIKEDTEKEIEESLKQNGAAALMYGSDRESLKKVMADQETSKYESQRQVAEIEWDLEDYQSHKDAKNKDLDAENEVKEAIDKECGWILEDFDKRREARKLEMEGLVEAKNYLMGVNAADEVDDM